MEGRDARSGDDWLSGEVDPRGREVPWLWKNARKVVIGSIGGTVILFGAALLVLPGPGTLVIILGLAILATEFAFAARWLRFARQRAKAMASYAHMKRHASTSPDSDRPAERGPDAQAQRHEAP